MYILCDSYENSVYFLCFSQHGNREFSPVQSDTEFETKRGAGGVDSSENKTGEELQQSWKWGQLPTSNHEETTGQEG